MNKRQLSKVLVIGAGPVVIGRGAEYDYAGVQACRALKEDGVCVVLVNSNSASLMTDASVADAVYIEPLDVDVMKRIIEKERPDGLLATMGGELALQLSLELSLNGFLDDYGVRLLSIDPDILHTVQDRQSFRAALASMHEPGIASKVVSNPEDACRFAQEIGYPVLIRPAYTLGGKSVVVCHNAEALTAAALDQLQISLIHQVTVEKCISGWKEIEYEVVRDADGNCISVCSMENVDPVGIHAGDSVIVVPAQTLTDAEAARLRNSALHIADGLKIEGSCNIRFALKPDGSEYCVMEADPRTGRSSALISKATGYPVAEVATKIALGYRLDEISNAISPQTTAANEPAIDYCAVKIPKWSFSEFSEAKRQLDDSMKATGEVLAIGTSFELAFMKAVRSIGIGVDTPELPTLTALSQDDLLERIRESDDERIFAVYMAIKRGASFEKIHSLTRIDPWFLTKLKHISDMEESLRHSLDEETYLRAKQMGFLDSTIQTLSGATLPAARRAAYKMVDTCAAEFDAQRPYFYSAWDEDNEAAMQIAAAPTGKPKALVIGSGPLAVGNGAELDFCTVHSVRALHDCGYETIVVNNNPAAVSTDFKTADRLYLDPMSGEDLLNLLQTEQPDVAVVQFGGASAMAYSDILKQHQVRVIGAGRELLHQTEDIDAFHALLARLSIPHTQFCRVATRQEAAEAAQEMGYPVRLRAGMAQTIAYTGADITEQFESLRVQDELVLVERYLIGTGIEFDAICDGEALLIPGICEHIERAGIHAGDAISVYPSITLPEKIKREAALYAEKCVAALQYRGILNFQFVLYDNHVYLTQISASSGRSIPFLSKVTGLPIVALATRCMLGEKLDSLGYGTGVYPQRDLYAVRVPVFSFGQLSGLPTQLGLHMKSTGEALGIAHTFEDALLKGLVASGMRIKRTGGVLITVRDADKQEAIALADQFAQLNFDLYATAGTAKLLNSNCVAASSVRKIHEGHPNTADLLDSGKIVYVVSTSAKGRQPMFDDVKIRRKAVERQIPSFTSLDTANALVRCLAKKRSLDDIELFDISKL